MSLRLGFHYHVPAAIDSGQIRTLGYVGRFLDGLAPHCKDLCCFFHAPAASDEGRLDYLVASPNVRVVEIGPHSSIPRRVLFHHRFTRPLRKRVDQLDALLARGPSPLLPQMVDAAGALPVVLLLVGDYEDGVDALDCSRWRRWAIRHWARRNKREQRVRARRALTLVNSGKLLLEYDKIAPAALEVTTNTMWEREYFKRVDTCQSSPIRLLYVGQIGKAKGVTDIIWALESLVSQGYDVLLDLVGWIGSGAEKYVAELRALAKGLGVLDRISFHGFVPHGGSLFAFYRQADVFLIPSYFEGFPRVIWEALAHSVPVVASRVGGIPYTLEDRSTALLVEPGSYEELSSALKDVITDARLRARLIRNGFECARRHSLEQASRRVIELVENWVAA